jgi:cargo-transport protein YPP1
LSAKDVTFTQQLPKLLDATEAEKTYAQDRYQGRTAVGWLHWTIGEYDLAAARLPKTLETEFMTAEPVELDALSDWTKTCALKAAYLRANCLVRAGQLQDALAVFESTSSSLAPVWTEPLNRKQLGHWTELFLTEYCMVTSQSIKEGKKSLEDTNSLVSFRAWARYWAASRKAQVIAGFGDHGSVPRRRVWLEYYTALSLVLQGDLPYPTDYSQPLAPDSSARNRLRTELKKVEASYEALLLSETAFPRAEEGREDIEEFIALVMQNWSVLNGRGWRDADLGQGGRESLNRGVLDILYRAATKTFHSVSILRSLFLVHLAVAEFDLAFKSFDSYLDLVKRGKARLEKTGHLEPSLDDDAMALETQAICIAALCRYGDAQAADKARELALGVEKWLQNLPQPKDVQGDGIAPLKDDASALDAQHNVPLQVLALAWQSIGLANAQWARITHDSASRTEIQVKAVACLRKSLSPEFGRPTDLGGVFALAVLLAEQRQLVAALEVVKSALLTSTGMPDDQHQLRNGPYWRERCLIPLWHLLALLLSARQDYVMAARACEGAFEQFKDPGILFGTKALNNPYRSDHLNEVEASNEKSIDSGRGVVDEMDDFEKESILEVKLTQLALVELLEGPEIAVNASLELLTLFSRLFGEPQKNKPTLSTESSRTVPKSSAGTIRSITGSIFGSRSDRAGRARRSAIDSDQGEKLSSIPSRPQTMQTTTSTVTSNAPAIQVTHENGNGNSSLADSRRARPLASSTRQEREPGKRNSLRKRDSSAGTRRAVSSGGLPQQSSLPGSEASWAKLGDSGAQDFFASSSKAASFPAADSSFSTTPAASTRRALGHTESFLSTKSKAGDGSGPAGSGTDGARSFLTLLPPIQFSKDHLQRRRNAMLVKLWLMIAGFYRRAGMYDDARGAIDEAVKLVQRAEIEVGRDAAGIIALKSAGWGGNKSVAELHGDVLAEVCLSCHCIRERRD